jgi:tRNA nucleotidyltransferase (CCA-adding enzyme)
MKYSYQGWGSDAYPGEEPQAKELRRDYTEIAHDQVPPDMHNWLIVGNQVYVSKDPHEQLFKQYGHANSHRPFAYGKMALHYRWRTNFQIEHSNISLHIVEKLLKQYANKNGFKFEALVDRDGEVTSPPKAPKEAALKDPHTVTFLMHENGKDYAVSQPGYRHHEILPMGNEVPKEWQQGSVIFFNPKWDDPSERHLFPQVLPHRFEGDPRMEEILQQATDRHNYVMQQLQEDFEPKDSSSKTAEVPGIGNILPGIKDWQHKEWMEDPPGYDWFEDAPSEKTGDGIYSCPDCGMEAQTYEQLIQHMRQHIENPSRHEFKPVVDYDKPLPPGFNNNNTPNWVAVMSAYGGQWADFYGGDDAVRVPFYHYPQHNDAVVGMPGDWHGSPEMKRREQEFVEAHNIPQDEYGDYDVHTMPGEIVFTNFGPPEFHYGDETFDNDAAYHARGVILPRAKRNMLRWKNQLQQGKQLGFQRGETGMGMEDLVNRGELTPKWNDPEWAQQFKLAQSIPGPIPFTYNVKKDRIFVGQPGQINEELQHDYDPLGSVQCIYKPDGNIYITSDTNMPYTVKHLIQLWYYMHRELPVKNVFLETGGKRVKLGNANDKEMVGQNIRYLVAADQAASDVNDALSPHGNVYVVGGAIRDLALGRIPKDVDMMAQGIEPAKVEQLLRMKARETGGSVNLTGKDFGVFRYKSPNGDEVEIALPRAERSTGEGHKDFDVSVDPHMPVEGDLSRRDFTPNAMAVDLSDGNLHDPFGGWDDVKAGKLPLVNEAAFRDDPLRILRALSAHSRYGLTPTPETEASMREHTNTLQHLPAERIQMELDKLLSGDNPAEAIKLAQRTGVLQYILPEVAATHGFDQRNKHHNQELFDHLVSVLHNTSQTTKDPDVRMAALLHDIGKPGSQWFDADIGRKNDGTWPDERGWAHYYREHNGPEDEMGNRRPLDRPIGHPHEDVGAELGESRLRFLKYPNDRIDRVTHLVKNHMFAPFGDQRGARRFVNRVGMEHAEDLLTLRGADADNKASPWDGDVGNMRQLVQQVHSENQPTGVASLAINGRDLIAAGIQPGPTMGRILNALAEETIDDPVKNNRDYLLQRAHQIAGVTASILDPVQASLDPDIFEDAGGKKPKVKPEVAHWIVNRVDQILRENNYDPKDFKIALTGSLTTYQWSDESDCDISLFPDYGVIGAESRAKLIAELVDNLDADKVPGSTHIMQTYIVPAGIEPEQLYVAGLRSGYDLRKGKWIVAPERDRVHDVYTEVPATLAYAREQADKMRLLLKYDKPGAKEYWKQIHQRRRRDEAAGKGDYSESNVIFKFIGKEGLYPEIGALTGEKL